MIGRVEISEILGMAGTCAVLLFAGFSVETYGEGPASAGAVAGIRAPEVPAPGDLLEELRLETPSLARPLRPNPPDVVRCEVEMRKRHPAL